MTELVTFGETSLRLSPAGDERLESATDVELRVSGTESNVAVAASAMGADATWLSKLPDTPLGRRVERSLREHGVETEVAWADDGRQGLQFAERGRTPRDGRLLQDRHHAAAASVTPGELPMDRIQRADATFVAGSTLSLSGDIVETAEAVLRAAGSGLVAMDLDFQPGLWSVEEARETLDGVFDAVDVLIANEEQARTVFDRTGKPRELAHAIASAREFDTVVITRSEHGVLAYQDSVIHEQDGIEGEVVDPAGQHEAFTGAFLERVLSGADAGEALACGVASATLARTLPGAMTTATREEVDSLVEELQSGR
ncbi:sugar kinase [Halosimplex salinum]|uniref:sugar kinase n=1 Tax=Halosimplex salinum TaxID=1710538 RepID=UPI000F49B73B|nr:sugar kinase [Halosimplex salinum]